GVGNQTQIITDGNVRLAYCCSSTNHSNYQIATYPSIRNGLTDAVSTNLDNTGSPFGPGDYTGANQWGVALAAAGSAQDSLECSVVLDLTQTTCPGDTNGNGVVNIDDLTNVILQWGACP
ncbi:MAG TPA: hypothetical protein VG711_03060, partial [Phycisphaerales bacterium]|nr:hypothetical protein [Phycisphaerales bacterium]